jgi:hypothetical protein
MFFCSSRHGRTTRRIRGRAVKALRSGRSQLCWRGFESHRMQHLFCFFCRPSPQLLFIGLGCGFVTYTHVSAVRDRRRPTNIHKSLNNTLQTHVREKGAHKKFSQQSLPRPKPTKKGYGGTGIRARVKRITTAYANHYTIPPRLRSKWYS